MLKNTEKATPKKPFYVVCCPFSGNGLFSIYGICLSHILYANKMGYIPIVDLKHYSNQYFKDNRAFKDNVWEYFFRQPAGFSLDDIKEDSDVIISRNTMQGELFGEAFGNILKTIETGKSLNFEKYCPVHLNEETERFLEENCEKIAGGEREILGIICRGSDYRALRLDGHEIQPDVEDVLKEAEKLLGKLNCRKIYLASEDEKIYERFQKKFGDILLENPQYKYRLAVKKPLSEINPERENHFYNLAREYMLSLYVLAKCKYLIGGITSALFGIYMFSKGFKNQQYVKFWRIGNHHNTDIIRCKGIFKQMFHMKNLFRENAEKWLHRNRSIGFDRL